MVRSLLGLAIAVLVSSVAAAQQPPTPVAIAPGLQPRDPVRQQPPATGTSRIRGRVVAADTGQAIRRAVVRISASELRETRTTSTDAEGRYEFRDLPAGRYTVTASKGAFVTLSYGQTRPFEQGRPLQLLDKQAVEKIDFALPRGSIITGRVIDEYGDPVADVQVAPMRMQLSPQGRRPMPSGRFVTTNDVGEFRMFGLPPGEYFVSVTLRSFEGPPGTTDDRSGYAATYYPGTPNVAEAQLVKVGVGETVSEITVMLTPTRTAQISGVALDGEGKPLSGGFVMVIQRSGAGMFMGSPGAQIRPDGSFSIGGLAPGEYMLRAMSGFAGPDAMAGAATAKVTVNGADVDGLRLVPTTPSTITGKVIVDPASGGSFKPETVRLMAMPKDPMDMPLAMPQPQAVKPDGTFELKAPAGTYTLNLLQAPNWMIKSAKRNGEDVMENGLEVRAAEDIENLQVDVTDRFPELSGGVADERGRPVIEFTAIAFPQQPAAPGSMARSSIARPDQDGRFKFRPLRPGSYYVVAVEYIEQGQWLDPEYLERLRSSATRVTIGDAEAKSIDLKVVKTP
jgi:hypothetical protein